MEKEIEKDGDGFNKERLRKIEEDKEKERNLAHESKKRFDEELLIRRLHE